MVVVTDDVASLLGVVGDTAGGRQQGGLVARDLLHLGRGRGGQSRTTFAWTLLDCSLGELTGFVL